MLYGVKKKTSLMNLKIKPDIHFEFKIAAELRGATMSGLLHQHITQVIYEEKKRHTAAEWEAVAERLRLESEDENERAIREYGTHPVEINRRTGT